MTKGQILKHDFNEGNLTLYDVNGKAIYFEKSLGFWWKHEYDTNGNQTYYENSQGYWEKHEYDTNGNVTYFEDSDGLIQYTIW